MGINDSIPRIRHLGVTNELERLQHSSGLQGTNAGLGVFEREAHLEQARHHRIPRRVDLAADVSRCLAFVHALLQARDASHGPSHSVVALIVEKRSEGRCWYRLAIAICCEGVGPLNRACFEVFQLFFESACVVDQLSLGLAFEWNRSVLDYIIGMKK